MYMRNETILNKCLLRYLHHQQNKSYNNNKKNEKEIITEVFNEDKKEATL